MRFSFIKENKVSLLMFMLISVVLSSSISFYYKLYTDNVVVTIDYDAVGGQIFYDNGNGFNAHNVVNSRAIFNLPGGDIKKLRIDPAPHRRDAVVIRKIEILKYGYTRVLLGKELLKRLIPASDISAVRYDTETQELSLVISGGDPFFILDFGQGVDLSAFIVKSPFFFSIKKRILLCFAVSFMLTLIIQIVAFRCRENIKKYASIFFTYADNVSGSLIVFVSTSTICFITYYKFILNKAYLVALGITSDQFLQFLPYFLKRGRDLHSFSFPEWTFQNALGSPSNYSFLNLLSTPHKLLFYALGKGDIETTAYLIAWVSILLIIVSGQLYYQLFKNFGISRFSAIIGALCISFSGYMISQGLWYFHYQEKIVGWGLVLLASELWLHNSRRWYLIPLAVLFGVNLLEFFNIGLLFPVFLLGRRLLSESMFSIRIYIKQLLSWGALMFAGFGIAFFKFWPTISLSLNSSRGTQSFNSLSSTSTFSIENIFTIAKPYSDLFTKTIRMYSSDILGNVHKFDGNFGNTLSPGVLYMGLISSFLIFSLLLFIIPVKKRLGYILLLFPALLFFFFPFYSRIMSAFVTTTYKHSCSTAVVSIAIFVPYFLDGILKRHVRVSNIWHAFMPLAVLSSLFFILYTQVDCAPDMIYSKALVLVIFFLLTNGVCYAALCRYRNKICKIAVCTVVFAELLIFSSFTISEYSNTVILSKHFHQSGRQYYNDEIGDAVKYVKQNDPNSFYRIDKNYNAIFFTDPVVFDYFGVSSYTGFPPISLTKIINSFGLYHMGWGKYFAGFSYLKSKVVKGKTYFYRRGLLDLTSCKYYFSDKEPPVYPEMKKLHALDNINIYNNPYAQPLGFAFYSFINLNDFSILEHWQKDFMANVAVAVPLSGIDTSGMTKITKDDLIYKEISTIPADDRVISPYAYPVTANHTKDHTPLIIDNFTEDNITGSIKMKHDGILFLSIPYHQNWNVYVDGKMGLTAMVNVGFLGVKLSSGDHTVRLIFTSQALHQSYIVSAVCTVLYCVAIIMMLFVFKKRAATVAANCNERQ